MPSDTLLQLGAIGVLFLVSIREFFGYMKAKKNESTTSHYGFNEEIFNELRSMNSNHLHSIEKAVREGNDRLIESIHNGNTKMIEILGEIKGSLSAKR